MKGLHSLQPAKGSVRTKTRRGRGDGSGIGSYSGKGIKGQRARSGGRSGLTARSMKQYLLRIPKVRGKGYAVAGPKPSIINTGDLERHFRDGDAVTLASLRTKGLVSKNAHVVKILSEGDLTKRLTVTANSFSASARDLIQKAGGTVAYPGRDRADKKKAAKIA